MGMITDAPKRVMDRWGQDNNVLYVGAGCEYTTIQTAVTAAAGTTLGYKGAWMIGSAAIQADFSNVTTGSYFTLVAGGHPTDPDSTDIYEFTGGGGVSIPGAVEIDLTAPLDYTELIEDIADAIVATQGAGGDTSLDASQGDGPYAACFGVAAHDMAAAWGYFNITFSHPDEWSVEFGYVKRSDTMRKTVVLTPGTYTGPVIVPEYVDLVGTDVESCIITHAQAADVYATVLMDANTSIRGVRVCNTGTTGYARGIQANCPFYDTDAVAITHCTIEAKNWCIESMIWDAALALLYSATNLRVEANLLCSSNPIGLTTPHKYLRIVNNTVWYSGTSTSCHAFVDQSNGETSCYAVIANNSGRLEVTAMSAAPYCMALAGSGHRVIGNNIDIIGADKNAAIDLVCISVGAETLATGETIFSPIEISGNRFTVTYLGDAGDVTTSKLISATGATQKADLQLSDNDCRFNATGTKSAVAFVGANATPTTITVRDGGLGSFADGAITLTDAVMAYTPTAIHPRMSIANVHDTTPADAELDSAFGTPAALGEGWVGFVNDAGGGVNNYICWVSDGKWVFLKGTVAT